MIRIWRSNQGLATPLLPAFLPVCEKISQDRDNWSCPNKYRWLSSPWRFEKQQWLFVQGQAVECRHLPAPATQRRLRQEPVFGNSAVKTSNVNLLDAYWSSHQWLIQQVTD
jgi:hypothetical protein